jgi:hypothetical protein
MPDEDTERSLVFPFKAGGFDHLLLQRDGDVCLVQRGPWNFEVVLIQHHPARAYPDGRTTPPREGYPGSSQWGKAGWSYISQEKAEKRFRWQLGEAKRKSRIASESGDTSAESPPPFEEDEEPRE